MKRSFAILVLAIALGSCSIFKDSSQSNIKQYSFKNGSNIQLTQNITHFELLGDADNIVYSTNDSVSLINKGKLEATFSCPGVVCFLHDNRAIHIATTHGYYRIDRATNSITQIPLPSRKKTPAVNALVFDKNGILWIGTEGEGLFSLGQDASIHPEGTYFLISSLAVTQDSSLWIGTNIGIVRKYADGRVIRYYEETSNGISLPDNIVEHLQVDRSQNIWIFMSSAVSVLTPRDYAGSDASDSHEDPMTYAYLGSEATHISKFYQHPTHPAVWWALTNDGVLKISGIQLAEEQPEGAPDKLPHPKGSIEKIETLTDAKGSSVALKHPNDLAFDNDGNLWVATDNGLFCVGRTLLDIQAHHLLSGK